MGQPKPRRFRNQMSEATQRRSGERKKYLTGGASLSLRRTYSCRARTGSSGTHTSSVSRLLLWLACFGLSAPSAHSCHSVLKLTSVAAQFCRVLGWLPHQVVHWHHIHQPQTLLAKRKILPAARLNGWSDAGPRCQLGPVANFHVFPPTLWSQVHVFFVQG